jgi:hypothetical protein
MMLVIVYDEWSGGLKINKLEIFPVFPDYELHHSIHTAGIINEDDMSMPIAIVTSFLINNLQQLKDATLILVLLTRKYRHTIH